MTPLDERLTSPVRMEAAGYLTLLHEQLHLLFSDAVTKGWEIADWVATLAERSKFCPSQNRGRLVDLLPSRLLP